jgi:hydrogenase maturation factor
MTKKNTSKLEYYIKLAVNGTENDIDLILNDLNDDMTIRDSKFIDFALGLVKTTAGVERITEYLFTGTQIQRNYCTLFFNRRCEKGDWVLVKKAYTMSLIDEKQAFSK